MLSHKIIENVMNKQSCRTIDLGGTAKTRDMTRAILDELEIMELVK